MQLAAASLECACGFAFEHHRDQAVARIEQQRMQCTLRARAIGRRILLEGELKEGDEVIVGIKAPKEPQGFGAGGALPPGFGSQPSDRPGTRMPRGL